MARDGAGLVCVGTLEDLKQKGCISATAQGHDIVIFYHQEKVYALDNRCPHMGFPLSRGSTKDGILTCDWHHARFDLKTGGCFDLWADDVPAFPATVKDGKIWVSFLEGRKKEEDLRAHLFNRLRDGLEQNIGLIIAKSVLALISIGVKPSELFRLGLEHGTRYRQEGWGPGLTILTCMMNLMPHLNQEDRPRALYHGLSAVSQDCSSQPPKFAVSPLPGASPDIDTLKRWFRHFVDMRDPDGAERCLVSAIRGGADHVAVSDMLYSAATDHRYLDSGHVLDFTNKAFEALDMAGWDLAEQVLTSLVPLYASATRMEERSSWRHPVDVAKILDTCFREKLADALEEGREKEKSGRSWKADASLIDIMLGDDPSAISDALIDAIRNGASEEALGSAVTFAAALRVAYFPTSNEYSDWDTALHTFTFANAINQSLRRHPSSDLVRGVFDAAMSNYLNRFLNVPSVALPNHDKNEDVREPVLDILFDTLDKRQQVGEAARLVVAYLNRGGVKKELLAALGHALLREDRSFHTIQMLEAAFRQSVAAQELTSLDKMSASTAIIVAATRYLAAHTPSARGQGQTFEIALRLHQGGKIYEEI